MNLELNGKSALVTGSTSGIGFGIAQALAREGAKVYVNGRTAARVHEAVARLQRDLPGTEIHGLVGDLSTAGDTERAMEELPEVDILVNNLGRYEAVPFQEISDEKWREIFDFNLISGARLSRFYLPRMIKKSWGRIVFISSESGVQIPAEMIHYGVTKASQIALARGLAELTVGTGVTVNSVLPGPTRSEGVKEFVRQVAESSGKTASQVEEEFFQDVRPLSLIKRFAEPEEVASLVAYVCSPLASAINGAPLRVEGGIIKSGF